MRHVVVLLQCAPKPGVAIRFSCWMKQRVFVSFLLFEKWTEKYNSDAILREREAQGDMRRQTAGVRASLRDLSFVMFVEIFTLWTCYTLLPKKKIFIVCTWVLQFFCFFFFFFFFSYSKRIFIVKCYYILNKWIVVERRRQFLEQFLSRIFIF